MAPFVRVVSAGPSAPPTVGKGLRHWLGRALAILTAVYVVALVVLLVGLEWWGERHVLLSLLLFAPPHVLLTPLLGLMSAALIIRPRLCLWHFACVAVVAFGYMTFRWHERPSPAAKPLVVITHNVGQGNRAQFLSFLSAEKPEVILLQDARHRGAEYARLFPDFHVAGRGEFYLISRHLIQQSTLLDEPKWKGRPVAARYEIIYDGQPLVLYNVHLPTPRSQFNRFLSRRGVADLFGDEDHGAAFGSYREWIDARVELARSLARVFAAEKKPFLACGDFNTPDHGAIYHLFAREMTDAFAHSGRGWGLTFPGETKNPLALFGAWLRIDYAFAGRGWKPLYCEPEPGRKSQHHAVVAHFAPAT